VTVKKLPTLAATIDTDPHPREPARRRCRRRNLTSSHHVQKPDP
jgi:hypothetical protein